MLLTEEEAKKTRCQESFPVCAGTSSTGHSVSTASPFAHGYSGGAGFAMHTAPLNCIGSACMAWRWGEDEKGPHLPDDLPIGQAGLLTFAVTALTGGYKTVGDVRRASDAELLRLYNFGKTSLLEVRRLIRTSVSFERRGYCGKAGKP